MKKLSGLGMGLSSLIPTKPAKSSQDNVFNVEINKIITNVNQPRKDFDQKALEELASSIKKFGILQPILVSKVESYTDRGLQVDYEVIAGERRLRAAKIAGLAHIPVVIKENSDESKIKLEMALIENLQREDLNPLEEAAAYVRLASEFNMKQYEIAERVSKSREVITNTIRLLDLPVDIQSALRIGKISRSHARALLAFKEDPKQQHRMFEQILLGNFVTREVEEAAKAFKEARGYSTRPAANPRFVELQDNFSKSLKTAVIIKSSSSGGSISIKFSNLEQLNAIAEVLLG